MKIFEKNYDGESIIDIDGDLVDAMDVRFNPIIGDIPTDEYGFHLGKYTVTITWEAE